jgi:hypothetical protein
MLNVNDKKQQHQKQEVEEGKAEDRNTKGKRRKKQEYDKNFIADIRFSEFLTDMRLSKDRDG